MCADFTNWECLIKKVYNAIFKLVLLRVNHFRCYAPGSPIAMFCCSQCVCVFFLSIVWLVAFASVVLWFCFESGIKRILRNYFQIRSVESLRSLWSKVVTSIFFWMLRHWAILASAFVYFIYYLTAKIRAEK